MSRIPRNQEQVFGPSGRRLLYEQTQHASEFTQHPDGQVAMVLLEVARVPGRSSLAEGDLEAATSKLSMLLNRRLRSIDTLVRTADTEIAVLLAQAHLGVAAAFSERLKQPIDQALSEMDLASDVVVCMGLAANPPDCSWRADELIELADHRMRTARRRAWESSDREWAVEVDGDSVPQEWSDTEEWPATTEMTIHQTL
jgi:Diguanylate cyclase, GGDEF domain